MTINISDTYELMSAKAAEAVIQLIQSEKRLLLSPASGDSPSGLYKELGTQVDKIKENIGTCYFVGLDEWLGMNGNDQGSCRFYLNNQLFNPLNIKDAQIAFFDGRAKNLKAECDRIEDFIQKHAGIDLAIVGLGMNGHVGMNEPGTPPYLHSHVAKIDSVTQQVGQKYFKKKTRLSEGITLGISNLMEAKKVFLLVNGEKKSEIVKRVLKGEISQQLPASFLRNHKDFTMYLDASAASLL